MLLEAFLHTTAKSSKPLRRLGLVGDAVALRSRANRQRVAWRDHEGNSRRFVERAVARCGSRRTAVVLGSGLLRDVPFDQMASTFERVVLVDAVHLIPARIAAWRRGAKTIVADLSCESSTLRELAADPAIDLVVSANLLSQMPLPHRRRSGEWDDPSLTTTIGLRHLADLFAFCAVRCLVTDVAYRDEGTGEDGEDTPLVEEALLPPPVATWDWTVAPRGEISRAFARVHRVGAWCWEPEAGLDETIRP